MTSGSNIETEYLDLNKNNEWPVLYQRIRAESAKYNSACTEAIKPQNKILNRYRDVSPYDHSRIILQRGSTDYINANLVKVEKANRQYILTQGPLINTIGHFWLMVWEQNSKAILMLNKLIEKKQEKCYQYWPKTVGSEYVVLLDDVSLTLEYVEQHDYSYYLTRLIRVTDLKTSKSRDVLQFHYTTWPDFGVPQSPTHFLEFLRKVRDAGVLEPSVGPAVVHCSAGIGRSGSFCLVDSCLVLIEKFGLNSVNIKEVLFEMRKYRMGLIQTPEQLRFTYQAIIEGANQLLNPTSSPEKNHILECNNVSEEPECNNVSEEAESSNSDDDDPPPLPPPRLDSLKRQNGVTIDRPLPSIPHSVSLMNDINCSDEVSEEYYIPSGPLPVVPADEEEHSDEDELEDSEIRSESPVSEKSDISSPTKDGVSSSELRHRKRIEHKEKLEAQVRDMKRRQQANEQWTQLKRSLYKPLILIGTIGLGGGLIAYLYFKG